MGSPERETEVTSQPRETATLHIREPGGYLVGWVRGNRRGFGVGGGGGDGGTEKAVASAYYDLLRHGAGHGKRTRDAWQLKKG